MPHTLGTRIRAARRDYGLTQQALADWLGLANTTISKIEHDAEGVVGDQTLLGLSEIFELDADELFALANKIPPDIVVRLKGNLAAIKAVREALVQETPYG